MADGTWWEHALNALAAGYDMQSRKRAQAESQAESEREARRRARAKGLGGSRGTFSGAPRRRVKLDDEPCCDGPRRK